MASSKCLPYSKGQRKSKSHTCSDVGGKGWFQLYSSCHRKQDNGICHILQCLVSWSGRALYLDDLYVQDDFRGMGIGTQLFDRIVELARERHCKKLKWQVSNWNMKAISFYKKRGVLVDEAEINCDLMLA